MGKTDRFLISFILLFGIAISLSYLFFGLSFPVAGDSEGYDAIALNLTEGKGFSLDGVTPTIEYVPAYPLFLATIYKIFGHNYTAVRVIQVLVLGGIGVLTYLISRKHLKLSLALSALGASLVVIWPYFVLYTTLILTEILYAFFLILATFFLLEFHKSFSKKSTVISGLSLGIATLLRPVAFFLPIWFIFFWLIFFKRKREIFKKQLLMIFIFILVLSPWTVRNFIHFNEFIPTYENFFPSIGAVFAEKYADYSYYEPLAKNLTESLKSRLKNIIYFWNPGAQGMRAQTLLATYSQIKYVFPAYKVFFFLILFLAFLSLLFLKRKEISLLWSVIFYFWLVHLVILPYPRYTFPIIPLVIILAFFFIEQKVGKRLNNLTSLFPFVKKQVNG